MAEKLNGMQIITFDNAEPQKRGRGLPFTEMGLEVNMHSNYISVHFNYEATQGARKRKSERKKDRQKHTELDVTAYKLNI